MTQPNTDILYEAAEITEGRSATHGEPEDSFSRIARYWNDYLVNEGVDDPGINEGDVADLLALFKLARSQGGEHNPDDNRDRVGYIAFAESFDMTEAQPEERDLDAEIDELAMNIERSIEESRAFLDDLPTFEDRRKGNTVQLRKVLNGDIDGLVVDDE
jgi:hypothetical protein